MDKLTKYGRYTSISSTPKWTSTVTLPLSSSYDPFKQDYNMLTADEKSLALETTNAMYGNSGLIPSLMNFNAYSLFFKNIMFPKKITKNISAIQWWHAQADDDPVI